ncbi:MAG: putative peptide zinc metalloprotease protein [Paracoccaceae bacterium]|jgi:putative peptide zinc metalloprotease protein
MDIALPAGIVPAPQESPQPALPRLREDVALLPGPHAADGDKSWLIHDPVRNAFFRIGWQEFEILSRWDKAAPASITAAVNRETSLSINEEDIGNVAQFMIENELTVLAGPQDRDAWRRRIEFIRNKSLARRFQENLFLRIPLVDPDRFLTATAGVAGMFFTRGFWLTTLVAGFLALILVGRQWDSFIATFPYFFSFQGLMIYAVALSFAKVIHELGHAFAAKRHGLRVPSMGVAFLVFWPVLFTDTTDSWRLRSGGQRFIVAGAGMAAEIALAAWALLTWTLLPPGAVQSAVFALATATWILTLVVNLNPLIRFDGYFLLSDALGVKNLQPRAFALLRHNFRTWCLGVASTDPEPGLGGGLRRGMVIYAMGALAYRVILAIGIGAILYYMAFKLLGIIALGAVIVIMIFQPAIRELRTLFGKGQVLVRPVRLVIFIGLLAGGVGLIFYPWQGTISSPAILKAAAQSHVYSPYAARVAVVHVQRGDTVTKGAPIATLTAPEIEYRLRNASARAETFQLVIDRIRFREDIADQEAVIRQQLAKAVAEAAGYRSQLNALVLRAPFDGSVRWMSEVARPGNWIRPDSAIALVVDSTHNAMTAYIEESDLARIDSNARGKFYAYGDTAAPALVTVRSIAASATDALRDRALASIYGGPIPARAGENGIVVPEGGIYEARLRLDETQQATPREITGIVRIDARTESIARRLWRQVNTVLVRESGF